MGIEEAVDVLMLCMIVAPAIAINFEHYVRILRSLPSTMRCVHNGGASEATFAMGKGLYSIISSRQESDKHAQLASVRGDRRRTPTAPTTIWNFVAVAKFVDMHSTELGHLFSFLGCDYGAFMLVNMPRNRDTLINSLRCWFLLLCSPRFEVKHT